MNIFDYQELLDKKVVRNDDDKIRTELDLGERLDKLVPEGFSYNILYLSTQPFKLSNGYSGFQVYIYNAPNPKDATRYNSVTLQGLKVKNFDDRILNVIQELKYNYSNGRT